MERSPTMLEVRGQRLDGWIISNFDGVHLVVSLADHIDPKAFCNLSAEDSESLWHNQAILALRYKIPLQSK